MIVTSTNAARPESGPGIVSIGDHFTDGNVHLISNYHGMDSFLAAYPQTDEPINIAYVATASKPYEEKPRFAQAEESWLGSKQEAGIIAVAQTCLIGKTPEVLAEELEPADVIFVGGGDTAYLLQQIQDSGAVKVIKDLVSRGTWYFGKSAGAIVAGPDIDPRGFILGSRATRPLECTLGLGLTQVFPIPHIDTPVVMGREYNGKTGWEHAADIVQAHPTAYILDDIGAIASLPPIVAPTTLF